MPSVRRAASIAVLASLAACAPLATPAPASIATPAPAASSGPSAFVGTPTAPATSELATWTWTQATLDPRAVGNISAIWPLDSGYAAVATRRWSDSDDRARATFLTSVEGLKWEATDFPRSRFGFELGVVEADRLTVFGSTGSATSPSREAWQTADGIAWTRLKGVRGLDFGPGGMQSMARTDAGWLAVGVEVIDPEHQRSRLFASQDMRRWRQLPWPDGVTGRDVASDGTKWTMLGSSYRDGSEPLPFYAYHSTDGSTWTRVLVADLPQYDGARSIVGTGDGFAIGGQRFEPSDESSNPLAWWSRDGLHWDVAAIDAVPGAVGQANLDHLSAAPEGLLATGYGDETQIGLWLSEDGQRWTQAAPVPGSLDQVDSAARTGEDIIVSGLSDPESQAEIWRGSPDR